MCAVCQTWVALCPGSSGGGLRQRTDALAVTAAGRAHWAAHWAGSCTLCTRPHLQTTHFKRPKPQVLVSLAAADGSLHRLPAAVMSRDPSHELIVLRVEPPPAGLSPVALGSSAGLRVGQDALLVGALPGGGGPTLAAGGCGCRVLVNCCFASACWQWEQGRGFRAYQCVAA